MSPTIRACLLALGLVAAASISTTAVAETIVIHADGDRSPSDPAAAMIVADVPAVLAARDADAARRDDGGFISGSRALASAERAGLAAGVRPWRAYLEFDAAEARVVWRIMNTTDQSGGDASGRAYLLDATTGDVVAKSDWSVTIR